MKPNTSFERVNNLERLSGRIYDAIDETTKGESRYRSMLRLCINLISSELNHGNSLESTGELVIATMNSQLERGGLFLDDPAYDPFPAFRDYSASLPPAPLFKETALNTFANKYADETRGTVDRNSQPETDGRHAVHLAALAVPSVLQFQSNLRPGVVALDAIIHDAPEVITGDKNTYGMTHAQYAEKVAREKNGLPLLKEMLGTDHAPLYRVIEAYEHQEKPEDSYVKAYDKEDAFFTHSENKGLQFIEQHNIQSVEEFIAKNGPTTERILGYKHIFPHLQADRAELIRRLAVQVGRHIAA